MFALHRDSKLIFFVRLEGFSEFRSRNKIKQQRSLSVYKKIIPISATKLSNYLLLLKYFKKHIFVWVRKGKICVRDTHFCEGEPLRIAGTKFKTIFITRPLYGDSL